MLNISEWSKSKIGFLILGAGVATFGFRYIIDNRSIDWENNLQQSSQENNKVIADFFGDKGDSLIRFLIDTNRCPERTEFQEIDIIVEGVTYQYQYGCNNSGYMIIGPKNYENAVRTMNKFEVSEKYGRDVVVEIWGKTYTFDTAGYLDAWKKSKRYRDQ